MSYEYLTKKQQLLRKQHEANLAFNRLHLRELEKLKDEVIEKERSLRQPVVPAVQERKPAPNSDRDEIEKMAVYNKVMTSVTDDLLADFICVYIDEVGSEVIQERNAQVQRTNNVFADIIVEGVLLKTADSLSKEKIYQMISDRLNKTDFSNRNEVWAYRN